MPSQLLVRNLDDEVVEALKQRAAKHGRSVEEEHRRILKRVLCPKRPKKTFLEHLLAIPPSKGEEEDALFDIPRKVEERLNPFVEDDR